VDAAAQAENTEILAFQKLNFYCVAAQVSMGMKSVPEMGK